MKFIIVIFLFQLSWLHGLMVARFEFGNHTYEIYDDLLTWSDARDAAKSKSHKGASGYLTEVNSEEENIALYNKLKLFDANFTQKAADVGSRFVWLGASDLSNEGTWVWDNSGTNFYNSGFGPQRGPVDGLYSNWGTYQGAVLEPDGQIGQNAAAIGLELWVNDLEMQWNDIEEDNTLPYIVEYDVIPEGSNLALALGIGAILFVCYHRHI
jgi:hypothetical protein